MIQLQHLLRRAFSRPSRPAHIAWMTVLAMAGIFAATPRASAVTIDDTFTGTVNGVPAGWSVLTGISDPNGTVSEGNGAVTITDPRDVTGDGGGPVLIRSNTSFGPIKGFTAQVNIASTAGHVESILAVGDPSKFALVVQFDPTTSQFSASVFSQTAGQSSFKLGSVVAPPASPTGQEPASGALSFTVTATNDSFEIICTALNYDSLVIPFSSAALAGFSALADLGDSAGLILGGSANYPSVQGSVAYDHVNIVTQDVVTSVDDRAQIIVLQEELTALLPTGDTNTDKKLQAAIGSLSKSLASSLWLDEDHLAKNGQTVFEAEKQAIQTLEAIATGNKTPDSLAIPLADVIDKLLTTDFDLASTAVADATAAGGDPTKIADANSELAKSAAADQAGKVDEAIEHAKQAWLKAQNALKK